MDTLTRWRLILGGDEADGTGVSLSGDDERMDAALEAIYELERRKKFRYEGGSGGERKGSSGASQPAIARWLGDIRRYFPQSVVQVIQKDALRQPALRQKMLLDSDLLEEATPDVHLVATLLELKHLMPAHTRDTAQKVVQKVVDELMSRLRQRTTQAITGALNRQARRRNPRWRETDWHSTIKKNLRHYQPEYQTIIPETRIGYGYRRQRVQKDIILCIDQSGSMGDSVVYAGIFGAVLATLPGVRTHVIAFDTEVADLTEHLSDPVELLFGIQLGGGTDIHRALKYARRLIQRPEDTVLVLLSDLFEGGEGYDALGQFCTELVQSGVSMTVLPALSDEGAPAWNRNFARFLATLNVPVFACTPDRFPDLMAAAIEGRAFAS